MTNRLTIQTGSIAKPGIDRWYQCQRKKAYQNVKTARKRAREFGQQVYQCPQCGFYHLTSKQSNEVSDVG